VFTAHLIEAGADASVGTVGDALDNAFMESTIGLYKTELIKKDGPWRSLADVELATTEYVDWFNARRLHTAIGGVPPAEIEATYYAQPSPIRRLDPTPPRNPGRFSATGPVDAWFAQVDDSRKGAVAAWGRAPRRGGRRAPG
jgi:putative transposase